MEKSKKVLVLSSIVLAGFVLAVVFHYILSFYISYGEPYNTFLSKPFLAITDFTDLLPRIKNFAPYVPPANWQQYFPLAYLILMPFAYIKNKFLAYLIFISIFLGFFIFSNIKLLRSENLRKLENFQNIFIITALTYPFLLILDRGNFDMIIFIFFALFIAFFKSKKYQKAAIFLGIINAIKPFSVLFLVLFLFEKKYREFFLSIGTSFLLIIGGFMIFHGNIFNQIAVMLQSWISAQNSYILTSNNGMSITSSSLFLSLKGLFCDSYKLIPIQSLIDICKVIGIVITAITVFFVWKEKTFWKKICLLTLYMLTVPYIVFDYKLMFLFVPLWLFVNSKEQSKFDLIYTILFGLMLIPKKYFLIWLGAQGFNLVAFSVVFNPFIMLIFMGIIIFEQFYIKKQGLLDGKD